MPPNQSVKERPRTGYNPDNPLGYAAESSVPVFQPHIGVDTIKAVVDAFHVGWLGMGAATQEFENEIGRALGLEERRVVATNTGTSALHIALLAADILPCDEVIVPSFNFVADQQAITASGADTVFCDIREDNLGIDCEKAEKLITSRTKAIIALHFSGIPCDIDGVYALAKRHNLRVIEDATHAFGTLHGGRPIGSFGDLTCFSFDPVKIITSIDGGAVVCNSDEEVAALHHLRLLGIDKDTIERYKNRRAWEYDVVSPGFRYHLTNINASIGLSQLSRVNEFIANRQRSCRLYNQILREVPEVITPRTDYEGVSPFIYCIRVPEEVRPDLIAYLAERGIATGIHFLPVHEQTFYRECRAGDLSVTERVSREIITLPLHSFMATELVERIATTIMRFFA